MDLLKFYLIIGFTFNAVIVVYGFRTNQMPEEQEMLRTSPASFLFVNLVLSLLWPLTLLMAVTGFLFKE